MKTTVILGLVVLAGALGGCGDGSASDPPTDPNLRGEVAAGGAAGALGAAGASGAGGQVSSGAGGAGAVGTGGAPSSAGGSSGVGGMTAAGGAGGGAGSCGASAILCDGTCTDITVVARCGSCTNVCAAGQTCTNGQCAGGGAGGSSGGFPFCPSTGAISKSSSCAGPAHQQLWLNDADGLPHACVICTSGYDTSTLPCIGAELCVSSCSLCSP